MEHFKSVRTLFGTSYRLYEKLGTPIEEVSDITIEWDENPVCINVWIAGLDDMEKNTERVHVVIPYHAVELLVK